MRARRHAHLGFTLVEMIVVLVLVAAAGWPAPARYSPASLSQSPR